MFWSTMSTPLTYCLSQATSLAFFRSSVIERLPALTLWKPEPTPARNGGPQPRASSPPSGRSTLTTSAPSRASVSPANGPARFCASSRTLMPASGRAVMMSAMVARSAQASVGGGQRQHGERRRRIGHEQPAPGFASLLAVLAVEVQRVGLPGRIRSPTDRDAVLIGDEPLHAPCHHRVIAGETGLPERVHDHAG